MSRSAAAPRKIVRDLLALALALAVSEAERDSADAAEGRALLDGIDKAATGK